MGAFSIILVSLVTAALGALLFRRHGRSQLTTPGRVPPPTKKKVSVRKQAPRRAKDISPGNPFRAVSIVAQEQQCAASKALAGKYYLVEAEDVPSLPLPACDLSKCSCRYAHHKDRRQDEGDRRTISGIQAEMHQHNGNEERRARNTRRKTD